MHIDGAPALGLGRPMPFEVAIWQLVEKWLYFDRTKITLN